MRNFGHRITQVRCTATEMPALYQRHHVLLHPSAREACGFALVEAMQQGLPVACSDIPAFAAMVGADRCAPLGDAQGLAERALQLIHDPDARREVRARFVSALSYDAIAVRKAAVYRKQPLPARY